MKHIKKALSVLLIVCMLAALFATTASAKNTQTRGTVCTDLSTKAKAYYTGSYTYDQMSALDGGTTSSLATMNSPLYKRLQTLMSSTMTDSVTYKSLTKYWPTTDNNILFYSNVSSSSYNREHVWPKSRASFHQKNGGSDLHHLRPTNTNVNSTRKNYTMGNVNGVISGCSTYSYGGSTVLWYSAGNDLVEVRDNVKGDVARILLYVYVRWGQPNLFENVSSSNLPAMDSDDSENNGRKVIESLDTLLEWCEKDPVDTWEMARNDEVQAIQGNRNVFIDYPEYAWLLFDQELPAEMQTPSGEAKNGAPSYTLTAVSSNTAYGTVSLSGKTITAAPKTGYQIDDTTPYTVSPAGAATVTRSGNVFTVSNLKDNCTVTIHFTARQTANVTYHVPSGVTVSGTTSGYVGDSIRLATVSGQPNGTDSRFYGWASGNVAKTTTAPTVRAAGSAYTLTAAQADFYGVFAMDEGGTTYYTTNPIVCTHEHTKTESRAATCTEGGYERTVCLDCGMELAGTSEPALGHDYQPSVVAPTCTAKGYTLHTCSRCGENYKNAYTDALGHSYRDGKCTVCGEKDPNYQPPVDNTPKYEDFKDLPANAWYKESVGYALANGLMNGTGDGIFQPDGALTRAMLVTILYRSAGEPSVDGLKNPFQDVADGQWYTKAVVWAAGKGIVNGTSETTFDPDANITREQIAAILHRYAGKPETKGDLASFPDAATVSDYAKTAMAWAVEKGIIGGSDGKLDPRSNATRAQVAAILMRYLKLTENRPL